MILKDNLSYLSTSMVHTVCRLPMINLLPPDESNGMAASDFSAGNEHRRWEQMLFFVVKSFKKHVYI